MLQKRFKGNVVIAHLRFSTDLRGSTFHLPTLEILDELGVADWLFAEGLRMERFQFRERTAGIVAAMDMGLLKGDPPFPFRLQCPAQGRGDA